MPWTIQDARKHTRKAGSPAEKRQWKSTANAVLGTTGDGVKAIKAANAAITGKPPRKTKPVKTPGAARVTKGKL